MSLVCFLSFGSAGALPAKEPPLALTDQRVDWFVRRASDNAKDGTSADRAHFYKCASRKGATFSIDRPRCVAGLFVSIRTMQKMAPPSHALFSEPHRVGGWKSKIQNRKSKIQNPEVGRAAIPNSEFRIPNSDS